MTDAAPIQLPAVEPVQVPFDLVLERFAAENAQLTRRAVIAEAQVLVLQQQVANQKMLLEPPATPEPAPAAAPETPAAG